MIIQKMIIKNKCLQNKKLKIKITIFEKIIKKNKKKKRKNKKKRKKKKKNKKKKKRKKKKKNKKKNKRKKKNNCVCKIGDKGSGFFVKISNNKKFLLVNDSDLEI